MAHGFLMFNSTGKVGFYMGMPDSLLGKKLAQKDSKKKTILLAMWNDDFEPLYSIKAGRGSAWILTLTLEPLLGGRIGIQHVYPIALGSKGADHNPVLQVIWEDLKQLRKGKIVHNGSTKKTEEVRAEVIGWAMDQPECRSINGLLLGGSTSFARFGVACDVGQLLEKICPCRQCSSQMLVVFGKKIWIDRSNCKRCNNWMAHGPMTYEPPGGYPVEKLPRNKQLKATKITYALLKEATAEAHSNILAGEWTTKTATVYLKSLGLNSSSCEQLVTHANNMKTLNSAEEAFSEEPTEQNSTLSEALREEVGKDPTAYQPWSTPVAWDSGLDIQQCHQAGMHLLFLGVAKTMVFVIQEWASKAKKYSQLRAFLRDQYTELEVLKLSWLKIQPYQGEKLGGWISENYLGLVRVLPYLCAALSDFTEVEKYQQPTKQLSRWTVPECWAWLRLRNLQTRGSGNDVKQRVRDHWSMKEAKREVSSIASVKQVILCKWYMISYLIGMRGYVVDKYFRLMITVMRYTWLTKR